MDDLDVRYLTGFASRYANWLFTTFGFDRGYSRLFEALYSTEFTWLMDMDANRASDGVYLRDRFCYETGDHLPDGWLDWPCSILEMLVSLAFAMEESFLYDPDSDTGPDTWFWEMLSNCGLDEYDDGGYSENAVSEILKTLLNRQYDPSGKGGIFPLKNPNKDQRNVEIWFQMNAYIQENWVL